MSFPHELTSDDSSHSTQAGDGMQWSTVREGFWIGRIGDRFSGVIHERWTGGFLADLSDGSRRGPFSTLLEAQACYEQG